MPNPIDSENVIAWLNAQIEKVQGGWLHDYGFPTNVIAALTDVKRFVKNLPTIEPEEPTIEPEVRHGRWLSLEGWFNKGIVKCSVCGNTLNMEGVNAGRGDANFCPNCGARMDATDTNGGGKRRKWLK